MKNNFNQLYKIIIFIIILLILYLIIDNYNHDNLKNNYKKRIIEYKNGSKLYSDLETFNNCKNEGIKNVYTDSFKKLNLIKRSRNKEFKLNLKIKDKEFDLYILDNGTDLREDYNLIKSTNKVVDDLSYSNGTLICKLIEKLNPKIRLHTYKICDYKNKVYLKDYIEVIENIKKENSRAIIISNIIPFDEIDPENLLIFCCGSTKSSECSKFIQVGSYDYNGKPINNGIILAPCENIQINNELYSSKLLSVILFCVYACSNFDVKTVNDVKKITNIFEENNFDTCNDIFKKYI